MQKENVKMEHVGEEEMTDYQYKHAMEMQKKCIEQEIEIGALRNEIADLRDENAALKDEMKALRAKN